MSRKTTIRFLVLAPLRLLRVKRCSRCQAAKKLSDFSRMKSSLDGRYPNCVACRAEYRQENSRAIKEHHRDYYEKNAKAVKEYQRDYRQNNPEVVKERKREYRLTEAGKEQRRRGEHRRRAHKAKLPSEDYSRCNIAFRDEGLSWLTGEAVDAGDTKNIHVDHLVPIAHYIPGHPGDVLTNVALCEGSLNSGRRDRLTSEALQRFTRNVFLDLPNMAGVGDAILRRLKLRVNGKRYAVVGDSLVMNGCCQPPAAPPANS